MTEDAPQLCCSRCGLRRDRPSDRYCQTCRRTYSREWQAMQRRNLRRLKAIAKGVSIETMDDAQPSGAISTITASKG